MIVCVSDVTVNWNWNWK